MDKSGVKVSIMKGRVQFQVPYNERFVLKAHSLDGRWRKRSGVWSFPRYLYPQIATACNQIFGSTLPVKGNHDE